jgi:hypothetical protein
MDEIPFPIIRPDYYNAFWRLANGDLPDTYDEWLKIHSDRRLKRRQRGEVVIDVEVYPHEFARYCEAHNVACNLESLGDFAMHKFRSQRK